MTIASQSDEKTNATTFPLPPFAPARELSNYQSFTKGLGSASEPARRRNEKRPSRIVAAAAGALRSLMGLLASIVAYLSVVAAIVIGFLMSADALLHHSHQLAADQRQEIITAAKTDSLKTKKAVKPLRTDAEQRTIPQRSTAAEYRRKTELSNTRSHEPHKREARRGNWPLYRQPAPAPRALGYVEEPRFSGDPWRY